ncbi:MAG TPA: ribosome maturation factor RimP [Acidimicrobiales bacterium]|jgi:ribosome maturation factor RimP|nr:ribosome maturation factor RimP [Acidimicrobiales bacterium]
MTDMTDLAGALSPVVEARGLELIDVEVHGAQLTVFVDREGGVGLDDLGEATKDVSAALDRIDPLPGRYTLTVSSPGLERRLRTPAHFARAVGETVTVRVDAGTADVRRITGTLQSADETGCTLAGPDVPDGEVRISYDQIERARTVFEWGPAPRRAKSERVKRP